MLAWTPASCCLRSPWFSVHFAQRDKSCGLAFGAFSLIWGCLEHRCQPLLPRARLVLFKLQDAAYCGHGPGRGEERLRCINKSTVFFAAGSRRLHHVKPPPLPQPSELTKDFRRYLVRAVRAGISCQVGPGCRLVQAAADFESEALSPGTFNDGTGQVKMYRDLGALERQLCFRGLSETRTSCFDREIFLRL